MKRWLLLPCTFLATLIASATSSLDVIGAGYGRTGTSSLREALDLLGYKTYHMQHVMKSKGHVQEWMSVLNGKQALSEVVDTVLVTSWLYSHCRLSLHGLLARTGTIVPSCQDYSHGTIVATRMVGKCQSNHSHSQSCHSSSLYHVSLLA